MVSLESCERAIGERTVSPVGQPLADRLGHGLLVGAVGQHDADRVDVAGLGEQAFGRLQRQEDDAALA